MIKGKKLSQGQSLLEIVVTMGLGLVVITGIAIVTVNGLKNSQLSKNQAIATKLSQQGLEKVRALRSQNCSVLDGVKAYYWYNHLAADLVYDNFPSTAVPPVPPAGVNFILTGTTLPTCLVDVGNPSNPVDPDMAAFPGFTREIELLNLPSESSIIRVSAIVTWSDYSGDHESRLATSFGNN